MKLWPPVGSPAVLQSLHVHRFPASWYPASPCHQEQSLLQFSALPGYLFTSGNAANPQRKTNRPLVR